MSFFYGVDVDDEQQRIFVLDICTEILSSSTDTYNCFDISKYKGLYIDKLLKLVFQSNDVNAHLLHHSLVRVDFNENTLANVLKICKNKNIYHPEEKMKNYLINNIDKIFPGFNYLVDFEWCVNEDYLHYGIGDLIFGSDYGVYIVIETKWLNTNTGKTAQVSRNIARNKVKYQSITYKKYAQEKFALKVIGASVTNDEENAIQFVDNQDERIASIIKYYHSEWGTFKTILYYVIIFPIKLVVTVIGVIIFSAIITVLIGSIMKNTIK
ncbi:9443_t:CDS:2 [Rhizophagus irregularis]|nr:9443_t:CDS:2 [Rhizophagus irregularis]